MAKAKRAPKQKAAPFGKITQAMWSDAKFRALTPLLPSGQALWIYLLVGRERTQIPGVTACGRGSLTDSLRWSPAAFAAAWSEVAVQEMAEADWTAPMIWIPNAIKHNFPESPSVVIGWRIRWDEIPDCPLKHKAWRELRSAMQAKGEAWLQAFDQACREPVGQPVTQPVVEAVAQTVPHQEQEQEQELVDDKGAALTRTTAPSSDPDLDDAWVVYRHALAALCVTRLPSGEIDWQGLREQTVRLGVDEACREVTRAVEAKRSRGEKVGHLSYLVAALRNATAPTAGALHAGKPRPGTSKTFIGLDATGRAMYAEDAA